jgi:hypothetical protein
MPSQPFMSIGPYIKRGTDSLTREENVSSMGRKSSNCYTLCGPLSGLQLHTAKGTKNEMQQFSWGNWKADKEAKKVALTRGPAPSLLMAALFPCPLAEWEPWYTPQEQVWFKTEEGNYLPNGWWNFVNVCIAIPELLAPKFVKQFHEGTHSGRIALESTQDQTLQHKKDRM